MSDIADHPIYWSCRLGLSFGWLITAFLTWRHAGGTTPGPWRRLALLAALLGLLRLTRANWHALHWIRQHLESSPIYQERAPYKITLLALLVAAGIATLVWSWRRWRQGRRSLAAVGSATVLFFLFVVWTTYSYEDILPLEVRGDPRVLPGRYWLELSFLLVASLAAARPPR